MRATRRQFLQTSAFAALAAAVPGWLLPKDSMAGVLQEPNTVTITVTGLNRGDTIAMYDENGYTVRHLGEYPTGGGRGL